MDPFIFISVNFIMICIKSGYFEHMRKYPKSLIVKFYGFYSIRLFGTKLYFVIMKNIFSPTNKPHEAYDIKGSWINRHTKYLIEQGKLMKDEDFRKTIFLPKDISKQTWEQMSHDTRFLCTMNIMDYSLLLGIYYIGVKSDQIKRKQLHHNKPKNNNIYSPPILSQKLKESIRKPSVTMHQDDLELQKYVQ